jgi:hypothetical protein
VPVLELPCPADPDAPDAPLDPVEELDDPAPPG